MKMNIKDKLRALFTHPGNIHVEGESNKGKRKENQDNILMISPLKDKTFAARYYKNDHLQENQMNDWNEDYVRIAVADGMGGHMHGKEIAESTIEALIHKPPHTTVYEMRDSILDIHSTLQKKYASENEKRPGTTLVLADIHRKTLKTILLNIGDSRAYIIEKNRWMNKTCDHTITEFCYRDGEIDKSDYDDQIDVSTSEIVQALGYGSRGIIKDKKGYKPIRFSKDLRIDIAQDLPRKLSRHADVASFYLKKEQVFVLASDGLWCADSTNQWILDDDINYFHKDAPLKLINNALEKGSNDNISVVICGFPKSEPGQ